MKIFFYIPANHLPSPERRDAWLAGERVQLLAEGKSATAQSWIFQTWAALHADSRAELVTEMPAHGITITLSGCLSDDFRAGPEQFVAAVAADYLPHPGAQVAIVQNLAHARRLPGAVFIPHWPQPDLIPRDPARGEVFERVAFFGDRSNLAPELASDAFAEKFRKSTGATFEIRDADRWHDFSDVDAVVAIRDFTRSRKLHKPATKLYNAWLAGVPFIAGTDSAFGAEGHPDFDYLVARSPDEFLATVERLRSDAPFRHRLIAAGQKKTANRSRGAVEQIWRSFCFEELPARAARWADRSGASRQLFWLTRRALFFLDRKIRS